MAEARPWHVHYPPGATTWPTIETIQNLNGVAGKGIMNVYGLTESSAMATAAPVDGSDRPEAVGVPLPGTDLKIVDLEDGTGEMQAGEHGQVVIREPQVMKANYNRPEATAAVLRDGWLQAGDSGRMNEAGFLTLVDRKVGKILRRKLRDKELSEE